MTEQSRPDRVALAPAQAGTRWVFEDPVFERIWRQAEPYTMTSPERGYALYSAVRYIVVNKIHGAFVECGVWLGGSAMVMALTLKELGVGGRDLVLFDTFDGMTEPGEFDYDHRGRAASDLMSERNPDARERQLVRAAADEESVQENLAHCGYAPRRIRIVRGDVRETLARTQTGPIALLRLDTDFYDSTRCEFEELYPRVQKDGVVMIDDYGHWRGSKKAVDEYFASRAGQVRQPLLLAADYTGRSFVKTEEATRGGIKRYDYVPPGMSDPELLACFDSLVEVDPSKVNWPYLRHRAPHLWRRDARSQAVAPIGLFSYEEAVIVYNLARQFAGRRALEIGCHFGWGSAHLRAAGVDLDIVDPALGDPARMEALRTTLECVPGVGEFRLWAGFSPSVIGAVRNVGLGTPWSFAMIDGNHDGDAPAQDAIAVGEHCADDALVVFHDLTSPHVAAGLRALQERGWRTHIYNTMQILGVAWRGSAHLVEHQADPNVPRADLLVHLRGL